MAIYSQVRLEDVQNTSYPIMEENYPKNGMVFIEKTAGCVFIS